MGSWVVGFAAKMSLRLQKNTKAMLYYFKTAVHCRCCDECFIRLSLAPAEFIVRGVDGFIYYRYHYALCDVLMKFDDLGMGNRKTMGLIPLSLEYSGSCKRRAMAL